MLTDEHKAKKLKFSNWVRTNFLQDMMKILFSDEKLFDIDRIYNSQNDRIWTVNHAEANIKGDIRQIRKFPQKIMVWLGACSKGLLALVIFENGIVDHNRYINEVLPVALKYWNSILGMIGSFSKMVPSHTSMKKLRNGAPAIFLRSLIRIIGLQTVLI